jgi:hypothetical protein
VKIVLMDDEGRPVAEVDNIEQYDLSNTRGRAMLVDDILVALGHADRRRVLEFMRDQKAEGTELTAVVSELPERS